MGNIYPEGILRDGLYILDPFMINNGYNHEEIVTGKGSGGNYASTKYVKDNRVLELHFRSSLGLVNYSIGIHELSHVDYMKLLNVYGKNRYPGFSKEPSESFHNLLYDLENFCESFISGTGEDFCELADRLSCNPEMFKGFKGLPK